MLKQGRGVPFRRGQGRKSRKRVAKTLCACIKPALLVIEGCDARRQPCLKQDDSARIRCESLPLRQCQCGLAITRFRAGKIAEIGAVGIALDVTDAQITGSQLVRQRGVGASHFAQGIEITHGVAHHALLHRQ